MATMTTVILSRNRAGESQHLWLEEKIIAELKARDNLKVVVLPHLYDLKGDGPGMDLLRSVHADFLLLCWLYPRSAYWVLSANGIWGLLGRTESLPEGDVAQPVESSPRTIWCLDLRTQGDSEAVLREVDRLTSIVRNRSLSIDTDCSNDQLYYVRETTVPRWYPVVDYHRCTACGECLNFCLFGVYGLDDQEQVVVEQPDACRFGCPACSRICPRGAIVFPQHDDPAVAGDPTASAFRPTLDLSQLFQMGHFKTAAESERHDDVAESKETERLHQDSRETLDDLVDRVDGLEM